MAETAPYGSWRSPISAERVMSAASRVEEVRVTELAVWWSESRPLEGGRSQIVRRSPNGEIADVLPGEFSARSRVHAYGGGAWWLADETVFFVNGADQRIWRLDPGFDPAPLTPEPISPGGLRYSDGVLSPDFRWIVCVQELDPGEIGTDPGRTEALNRIVAVPATGGAPVVLRSEADFVMSPRLDARGEFLAWVEWNHPDMPWAGSTSARRCRDWSASFRPPAGTTSRSSSPSGTTTTGSGSARIVRTGGTCTTSPAPVVRWGSRFTWPPAMPRSLCPPGCSVSRVMPSSTTTGSRSPRRPMASTTCPCSTRSRVRPTRCRRVAPPSIRCGPGGARRCSSAARSPRPQRCSASGSADPEHPRRPKPSPPSRSRRTRSTRRPRIRDASVRPSSRPDSPSRSRRTAAWRTASSTRRPTPNSWPPTASVRRSS